MHRSLLTVEPVQVMSIPHFFHCSPYQTDVTCDPPKPSLSTQRMGPHALLDVPWPPTWRGLRLLTHPSFESSSQGGGATENVFDASDRAEGGDLAFWWNDIEKDSR